MKHVRETRCCFLGLGDHQGTYDLPDSYFWAPIRLDETRNTLESSTRHHLLHCYEGLQEGRCATGRYDLVQSEQIIARSPDHGSIFFGVRRFPVVLPSAPTTLYCFRSCRRRRHVNVLRVETDRPPTFRRMNADIRSCWRRIPFQSKGLRELGGYAGYG